VSELQVVLVGIDGSQRKLLPSNAIGIARTENLSELCALYNLVDVYINASYEESFGLTTAEALACGTPVVGYNNTGTREILEGLQGDNPNRGAILVFTSDVYEVYNSLKTILVTDSDNVDFNNLQNVKCVNPENHIQTLVKINHITLENYIQKKYDKIRQIREYLALVNLIRFCYSITP
jgi:glycosyltransferase involved in cell wall biosynthesis